MGRQWEKLAAVGDQLSAVGYRLSAASYQPPVASEQPMMLPPIVYGLWSIDFEL